jgi:hypothetical protein
VRRIAHHIAPERDANGGHADGTARRVSDDSVDER